MKKRTLTAGLAFFLCWTALPLILGVGYALLYSVGLVGLLSEGFTLVYWQRVLTHAEFWVDLGYSLSLAAGAMLLATGIALRLVLKHRHSFKQGLLSYLIYLPLAFPAVVAAFLTFQLLGPRGFFSRIALSAGLIATPEQFPAMIHDSWGTGILLTHMAMAVPFLVLLFIHTWENERLDELGQLAQTLGAARRSRTWRVEVPVLIRSSRPTLVLYFLFVVGSYEIPLLIGRESPQMVSVLAIRKLQQYDLTARPEAYIVVLIYLLLVAVLLRTLLVSPTNPKQP